MESTTVVTAEGMQRFIDRAAVGTVCTYHFGFLAVDRDDAQSTLIEQARHELGARASLALNAARRGLLCLCQRRDGASFEYLAVKADRQIVASAWP